MSRGRNIIGHLRSNGMPELLLRLKHCLPRTPVSTAAIQATSPATARSPDTSILHRSLRKDTAPIRPTRRRKELSSPDVSTTLRLLKPLLAHLLWWVCSLPMATLPLYFLIQERRIHLAVLLS